MECVNPANTDGIVCFLENIDLRFTILKIDGNQSSPPLSDFHGKAMTHKDVQAYLPNWTEIFWEEIPDSTLSSSESVGIIGEYQLKIQSKLNHKDCHKEIRELFYDFMLNGE